MKYLIKLIGLMAVAVGIHAETAVYTATVTNTSVSILTAPAVIRQITAQNTGSESSTIKFFDTANTNLTYSIGAYTNNVITTGSTVTSYTDILGATVNITNTTITVTPTLVSATTGNRRNVYTMIVPAGETLTYTPTTGIYCNFGLAATNINLGITATIEYSKVQ